MLVDIILQYHIRYHILILYDNDYDILPDIICHDEIYNDHPQESNSLSNQSAPSQIQFVPLAAPKETGSS